MELVDTVQRLVRGDFEGIRSKDMIVKRSSSYRIQLSFAMRVQNACGYLETNALHINYVSTTTDFVRGPHAVPPECEISLFAQLHHDHRASQSYLMVWVSHAVNTTRTLSRDHPIVRWV